MPNQNLQDIIDSLSRYNIPTSVANDENNDPYTLLGKINLVLKGLIALDEKQGTKITVAGVFQKLVDFVEDPQDQIDKLTDAVALNVEGIAHMNEIKQDKLAQQDLDNIAMLNQLPDKLNAKANQNEVTELATAVENNATEINNIKIKGAGTSKAINEDCLITILNNINTTKLEVNGITFETENIAPYMQILKYRRNIYIMYVLRNTGEFKFKYIDAQVNQNTLNITNLSYALIKKELIGG